MITVVSLEDVDGYDNKITLSSSIDHEDCILISIGDNNITVSMRDLRKAISKIKG